MLFILFESVIIYLESSWCIVDVVDVVIVSFSSMMDLITIASMIIARVYPCPFVYDIDTLSDAVIYVMYAGGTTRVLRALRINALFTDIEDSIARRILEFVSTMLVVLVFGE